MLNKSAQAWAELTYHFEEIINCINIKAFIMSLPVAYTAHFLGDWHLLEIWFVISCFDLLLGIRVAKRMNEFSWDKIGSWTFKILVHSLTIIAVGILAHAASIALKYDVIVLNLYLAILIGKELASVVKNARILKWPIPQTFIFIVTFFDQNLEAKVKSTIEKIFQIEHPPHNRRSTDKPFEDEED